MGAGSDPSAGSIPFDRIAAEYDRTRALSAGAMARVLAILRAELEPHPPCLEIGVGTGRIALPLSEEGIDMAGIDLSEPMLRRLVEKADGKPPFPLARADALRLPFRSGTFGSGLAMHVLHLIAGWRTALAELVRVVRPGGVIVIDVGGPGSRLGREIQERFVQEASIERGWLGTHSRFDVDRAMAELGARPRGLPAVVVGHRASIEEHIARLEAGIYSFTWQVDPDTRARAAAAVRAWAAQRFGPLDQPRRTRHRIAWRAYELTKR